MLDFVDHLRPSLIGGLEQSEVSLDLRRRSILFREGCHTIHARGSQCFNPNFPIIELRFILS